MKIKHVVVGLLTALITLPPGATIAQEMHEPDTSAEAMSGHGGAVWVQDDVNVVLFADAYWEPILLDTVKAANRALPNNGPKLHAIVRGDRDSCKEIAQMNFDRPTISVCAHEPMPWYMGSAYLRAKHHVVKGERATIEVYATGNRDEDRNTACHEFMHGLSWVDDDYTYPKGNKSCVQGTNPTFGKADKKHLEKVYDKYDKGEREHRGRRGGKQGGKRG